MLIYLLAIFSIYFIFLILLMLGWQEATSKASQGIVSSEFVSVVVAVRNEENTLPDLINTLSRQSYPHTKFEILLVDDHSTDKSAIITTELQQLYPSLSIKIFNSTGIGKKNALTEGIGMAKGEIILTTDADCLLPPAWIEGMLKSFRSNTNMVVGMVKIKSDDSFFDSLQFIEFASVMGSGIAFLGWGIPLMCNGASLAFRKRVFEDVHGYEGNLHISSGDDEFLMRKVEKKFPGTIEVVADSNCVVRTHPMKTLAGFFQQRIRWAGKWKVNDSYLAKALALFILIVQLSWVALLVALVVTFRIEFTILVIIKMLLEGLFLWRISRHMHEELHVFAFLGLQAVYPLYVTYIGLVSQFKKYQWKNRDATILS